MTGAEKIKQKIIDDAKSIAQQNIDNARKEASSIMKQAVEDAKLKQEELLAKADQGATDTIKKMIAVAQLEARKSKLAAKQRMVELAFNKAIEKMVSLPDNQYQQLLEELVSESTKDGNEEILLSATDKAKMNVDFVNNINSLLVKKGIKGAMKLSESTADILGGFILSKGNVEMNHSFETITKMKRDELETDVVKILF